MRIDGPQRYGSVGTAGGARRAGATGPAFALEGEAKTAEARQPTAPMQLGGLDALLSLQMVDDPLQKRRRGVKRGRSMLDALDEIKVSLLAGRIPATELNRLLVAVQGREHDSGDPMLEQLLDEIELRARVELAKLDRVRKPA